jgi:branched-chain amino acid aminotransferase
MEIPMYFTSEYLEEQLVNLVESLSSEAISYRAKLTVFRDSGGYYTPETNAVSFIISASELDTDIYKILDTPFEIELFKDYFIAPNLISTLKTNNKVVNVVGSIFAKENNYNNCLLLNTNKNVIEALNGNVFLVKGNIIKTAPLSDGCLKGIIREKIIEIISKSKVNELDESSISPFELQKADEIFITNVIQGIVPVTKYRKKIYSSEVSKTLLGMLNAKLRLD